jgi:dipeptidyl aminopeptidase/acylaminoacyl peptidase
MKAVDPVWSPDQRHIAFTGQIPGEPWRNYIVSADGGAPAPVGNQVRPQMAPAWSPDGQLMTFNEAGSETVRILDVATGSVSDLPGSEDLAMTHWAPDGKSIIARRQNQFVEFDVETRASRVIVENIPVTRFEISKDGQYLYIVNPHQVGPAAAVLRVTIADGTVEKITGLNEVRIPWGVWGMWVGFTPDGEPMMLRDLSIHHIYELDWLSGESAD